MKLYTEEQVRHAIKMARSSNNFFTTPFLYDQDEVLEILTPIKLPSDEEIEDKGKWIFNNEGHTIFTHYNTVPSCVEGAKWMRDKLTSGNNERK